MSSAADWTEAEQKLLEQGLLEAAAICNPREKWQTISSVVGTRDARSCAERYRYCRDQALRRQRAQEQEEAKEEEEEEEDQEEEEEPPEQQEEQEEEQEEVREDANTAASSSSKNQQSKGGGQEKWRSNRWRSGGQGGWWKGSWWDDGQSWGEGWSWQGRGEGFQEQSWAGAEEPEEDLSGLDENQRRALLMRREVEANRERLRLKQEREEEARRKKEQKQAQEQEQREEKRREHLENTERKIREQQEQQRARKLQEEQREQAAKAKAEQYNPGFMPTRMVGGREAKVSAAGWAARAAAGQRGHIAKQRKQQALEQQGADILANIAASKGGAPRKAEASSEEEDEDERPARSSGAPPPIAPQPAAQPAFQPPPRPAASAEKPVTKAAAPPPKAAEPARTGKKKKRWWAKIDGDCPISLAPISELPQPPFGLEAEGSSNMHYFDARFLASFLLSSCDFIDPVNRRPLTREECTALDVHLRQHHSDVSPSASVADAFTLFERHKGGGDDTAVHAVQREATAVLQHLFRFGSARRTDQRGRAIAYADAGLTVVDDDDILAAGPAASSGPAEPELTAQDFPDELGAGSAERGARGGWAGRGRGRGQDSSFPSLGPSSKAPSKAWGPPSKTGATAKAKAGRGAANRGGGRSRGVSGVADSW